MEMNPENVAIILGLALFVALLIFSERAREFTFGVIVVLLAAMKSGSNDDGACEGDDGEAEVDDCKDARR